MKRVLHYKIYLCFLLAPLLLIAATDKKGKYTKEKKISKSYSVNANATLKVDNSYGNVNIVTWEGNQIAFEITITASGDDEEKVQDKLDNINIKFSSSPEWVSAQTVFNKSNSGSWWKWNSNNKIHMKINYIVKIPITNSVKIHNDYGNINIAKLEGKAEIYCNYGKITTKELLANDNVINFDYTSNCYFEYIKTGRINADYSGFTVAKTNNLEINADYTKSEVEIAEDINYNCDYGSLKVHKTNSLNGNGDYLTLQLGDLYKSASIKSDYGSIKIMKLHKNLNELIINSDYTGVKIGYDPALNFNFDLELDYAGVCGSEEFKFNKKVKESQRKYYIGSYGNENSNCKIVVDSEYGGITFFKN